MHAQQGQRGMSLYCQWGRSPGSPLTWVGVGGELTAAAGGEDSTAPRLVSSDTNSAAGAPVTGGKVGVQDPNLPLLVWT